MISVLPAFRLRLVGHWMLERAGAEIVLRSRKARALIAYMALERSRSHSRATVCALLWPDSDETRAQASLRQCLTTIRNAFDAHGVELLEVTPGRIGLRREGLSIDLHDLFAECESGGIGATVATKLPDLPNLLSEFETLGEPFRSWILAERGDALSRASAALRVAYGDESRDATHRLKIAQLALRLDPFEEGAIRACMLCEVERDNPAAALRLYGQFFELLEREMDAEPSMATQDLAVSIKLSPGQVQRAPSVPATARRSETPLGSTIAILPFEVFGRNPEERFLQVGIMEHITCHLASFHAPSVISSNTTRRYLGATPRATQVGEEIGARYVLAGSIRVDRSEAGLAAQLIDTTDEHILWATTRTCSADDLLALNVPIAEEIARAIVPSVDAAELRRSKRLESADLEPYHMVLRAKDLIFKLVPEDFTAAGELLRRAVDVGPHFSPGHALLADWYSINLWEGWSDDQRADRAALDHHARAAIALSPRDGGILALWAHNRMMFEREYDFALSQFRNAIDLCPNDSETLAWSVPTLTNTRNSETAVRNATKAISLSPYDPFIFRNEHFLSFAHYMNGDYDRSVEIGHSCFRRAPNYRGNIRVMIAALCAAGRKQETIDLVEHHSKITPNFSVSAFKKIQGLREAEDREVFASYLLSVGLAR